VQSFARGVLSGEALRKAYFARAWLEYNAPTPRVSATWGQFSVVRRPCKQSRDCCWMWQIV